MIASGGNRAALTKQLRKTFLRYQSIFQKFGITHGMGKQLLDNEEQLVVEISKTIFIELN